MFTKPIQMPSAWYDAAGRVESMAAIANAACALQPDLRLLNDPSKLFLNTSMGLMSALSDVAKLAVQDIENIEKQLQGQEIKIQH